MMLPRRNFMAQPMLKRRSVVGADTFLNGFGDDNPPAEAIYAEYAQSECN
jgi:hypothetical protein